MTTSDLVARLTARANLTYSYPIEDILLLRGAADEIERLRAENARLRWALEKIGKLENVTVSDFDGAEWEHQRIARAALKQSEPKP